MEFVTQVHFSKKGPTRIRTGVVRIKTESDNHYTIGPVSYTHLDVYKRQMLDNTQIYLNEFQIPMSHMKLLRMDDMIILA